MTEASLQAYSSNNNGRRRNPRTPHGSETATRNGTDHRRNPGRLFTSSTRVSDLIYLPQRIPMEGRQIHYRIPQRTFCFLTAEYVEFTQHISTPILSLLSLSQPNYRPQIIYGRHFQKRRCRGSHHDSQRRPFIIFRILFS